MKLGLWLVFLTALVSTAPAYAAHQNGDFWILDSHQEAIQWVQEWESDQAQVYGRAARSIIPSSDPRYAQIQPKMAQIWKAYRETYPQQTKNLEQPPQIVLINDPQVDAYSMSAGTQLPFLFVIQTGALNGNDNDQAGLYAHELGHMVLRHLLPGHIEGARIFYSTQGGAEPLGLLQKGDYKLRFMLSEYLRLASSVGAIALPELHDLIVDPLNTSDFYPLFNYVMSYYRNSRPHDLLCEHMISDYRKVQNFVFDRLNREGAVAKLNVKERAALDALALSTWKNFRGCVGHADLPDLIGLTAAMRGISREDAQTFVEPGDVLLFNSAPDLASAFLKIAGPRLLRIRMLESTLNMNQMRIYTFEEQADEAAARVFHAMGFDSSPLMDLLADYGMTANEQKTCLKTLDSGGVPDYGPLWNSHHRNCYRIYHLRQFDTYLSQVAGP